MFAFESRDTDLRAESRLRERDRYDAVQIVALPLKERVLLYVQNNIEVTGRTAVKTTLAESGKADASAVFDSSGNFRVNCSLAQNPAFAFALRTRIGDYAARALASGTGARNTEEALLIPNLSAASAGAAGDGSFARRCAGATALFAAFMAAHRDFGFGAKDGFFEFQIDIFAQIGAALGAAALARASPKNLAQAKEVAENIAEILDGDRSLLLRPLPPRPA